MKLVLLLWKSNLANGMVFQVQELQDQVISLGGHPDHSGPVEPSVDIILQDMGGGAPTSKGNRRKRLGSGNKSNRSSKSVTPATNGQSDIAAEINVLLSENEMLKKKLTSLESHVSSGGSGSKKGPVLRQPSVMFALSSVHNVENGTPEDR